MSAEDLTRLSDTDLHKRLRKRASQVIGYHVTIHGAANSPWSHVRGAWEEWTELVCEYWRRHGMIPEPVLPEFVGSLATDWETCGFVLSPNFRRHTIGTCDGYGCRMPVAAITEIIAWPHTDIEDARVEVGEKVRWCAQHLREAIESGVISPLTGSHT